MSINSMNPVIPYQQAADPIVTSKQTGGLWPVYYRMSETTTETRTTQGVFSTTTTTSTTTADKVKILGLTICSSKKAPKEQTQTQFDCSIQ